MTTSHDPQARPAEHPTWTMPQLMQLATGYWASAALGAAVELGLFPALDTGAEAGRTAEQIAAEIGSASARHTAALLDSLAGLSLVAKTDQRYRIAPGAARLLSPSSPDCIIDALRFNTAMYQLWGQLPDCVRNGAPVVPPQAHLGEDEARTRGFVMGMYGRARGLAPAVVAAIDLEDIERLLDLGSGPGLYSLLLARKYPQLKVTQLDLPGVVKVARELQENEPEFDRISFIPADYRQADLPGGHEAVLFCGAIHQESPESAAIVLEKVRAALPPGGRVIIVDMMVNGEGTQPAFSALFGLNMMLVNPQAHMFSEPQLKKLLEETGFDDPSCRAIAESPYWLIEATRR